MHTVASLTRVEDMAQGPKVEDVFAPTTSHHHGRFACRRLDNRKLGLLNQVKSRVVV